MKKYYFFPFAFIYQINSSNGFNIQIKANICFFHSHTTCVFVYFLRCQCNHVLDELKKRVETAKLNEFYIIFGSFIFKLKNISEGRCKTKVRPKCKIRLFQLNITNKTYSLTSIPFGNSVFSFSLLVKMTKMNCSPFLPFSLSLSPIFLIQFQFMGRSYAIKLNDGNTSTNKISIRLSLERWRSKCLQQKGIRLH